MAEQLSALEAQRPFDLAHGPLVRVALLRLAHQDHMVLLTTHHIISDAWSRGVLLQELTALYAAFADGQPSPLPELPIQYADFALWQRQWLQDEQGSGVRGQEVTAPLPPPACGGTEGGRRQGSDVDERTTQNSKLKTQNSPLQAQLAYWKRQLDGTLPVLDLPIDHPRPAVQTSHGAHLAFSLSPSFSAALVALSRREGVTLFMTLLAALQALLARYSSQDDILVGTPIAGRTQRETEDLIGFFVNTLVLRTDLSGNPPFRDLLKQMRDVCLHAYAHQDLPFERLVEQLELERDLSRHPLFQVMLVLQNTPLQPLELPGLTLRPLPSSTQSAKFDLTLSLTETAAGLVGGWEYNTDLFERATITRMAGHFAVLLSGVVADPQCRLAELPLLTESEQLQLKRWNATQASYPEDVCLHELVAAQAARTPDAIAVAFDDRPPTTDHRPTTTDHRPPTTPSPLHPFTPSPLHPFTCQHLTYQELNHRANQLAHYLLDLGVGPEVRVGICLERSLELVVALLGVLKAGGAYLPLDPAYPEERLAFMLDDARVPVLLTQQAIYDLRFTIYDLPSADDQLLELKTQNPGLSRVEGSKLKTPIVVRLDADWPSIAAASPSTSACPAAPANLAYLIYTSGSTGTPKGVAITHRSAVALLAWARSAFTPAQRATVLAATSICFDLSLFELFVPLCWGGTIILVENVLQLSSTPAAQAVTLINSVPSAIGELIGSASLPRSAHTINLAGEVLPLRLVQQLYQLPSVEQVVNLYGPSEATTYSSWAPSPKGSAALPAIGQPISNTQIYLLDRQLQPVPIGVAGELYIGGAGLARGYLGRPDLTAERFVPNPFVGDRETRRQGDKETEDNEASTQNSKLKTQNLRLYRTGDLARCRADGSIEFLGRRDEQVKLRGFRIELGEIESALAQHPAVGCCAVLVRENLPGEKRLVAYLVTSDKLQVTSEDGDGLVTRHSLLITELRTFLQQRLPDYMIPSAFVTLDVLPLTPNGKLDRRALPPPDTLALRSDALHVAPRDRLELRLAQIWEDVLALYPLGITDNFFALGGHSLLAVRLLAQIERLFERRLPLAALFQNPTITQLAEHLRQQGDTSPWSPLVALQPSGTRRPFFCVHPVSGSVLCYLELARALGANQPFYGLQAAGLEGEQPPLSEVRAMANCYVAALRGVQAQGPYQLGGWSLGGVIALEMARQLRTQGQEVALLALLDTLAPGGSWWRAPAEQQQARLLADFMQDLAAQAGQTLDLSNAAVTPDAPEQAMRNVVAQAQAQGLLPPDMSVAQIEQRFAVFKANLAAVERYVAEDSPCPIVVFRASDSAAARAADAQLGWGALAAGALEVVEVAGDHYTMVAHPHVQQLAQRLHLYLAP